MKTNALIHPARQTNWDLRAATNFICGGSGTGLLLFAALVAGPTLAYRPFAIAALVLIALGLFSVSLEIGRPLRSMNVFLHAHTSWMSREALVAGPLFVCTALAAWQGASLWIWLSAALAMLFLYCQANMVQAAKGIPAWRAKLTVPLFIVTGLTEGAGLLTCALALSGTLAQVTWLPPVLALLLVLRAWLWRAYRRELNAPTTPKATLRVLASLELPLIKIGHWAVLAALLLALALPVTFLFALTGLLAAAGGWLLKYSVMVPASVNQGYALPHTPVRGARMP